MKLKFQKTGFLMLRDSSRAIVQGKLFSLGKYQPNLLSWMPELQKKSLIEIQHRWGITLLIAGSLSLLLSTILIPIWGCVLIGLGLVNLLLPGKGLFLLNGLCLIFIGSLDLFASMVSITSSNSEQIITTVFWMLFGLWLMIWGGFEINELRKYRGLTL